MHGPVRAKRRDAQLYCRIPPLLGCIPPVAPLENVLKNQLVHKACAVNSPLLPETQEKHPWQSPFLYVCLAPVVLMPEQHFSLQKDTAL